MRYSMILIVVGLLGVASVSASGTDALPQIVSLRLEGRLEQAQRLAEEALVSEPTPHRQVELHLELARIHDRFGLHWNKRPVPEALQHVEMAAEAAEPGHMPSRARIELAGADYFYRAEMQAREFPIASRHAQRAIELFGEIADKHGEADAVHRLGLIEMQRRNLDAARELFDRSLVLDRAAGERAFFRGEYERHVGFVLLLQGDTESAIPYFERSLAFRRDAGAIDASLFAAGTLSSALVEAGRLQEAWPHLAYAITVAQKIGSPVGQARIGLVQGRLHALEGDSLAARLAFEMTINVAESVGYTSVAEQAKRELDSMSRAP